MKSLTKRLEKLEKENNGIPDLVTFYVPANASKKWKPEIWSKKKNVVTFPNNELYEYFRSVGYWGECEKVTILIIPPKRKPTDWTGKHNGEIQ